MTGRDGFARMVPAVLGGIAGNTALTKPQAAALSAAGVLGNAQWERVAACELKKMNISH
jgi:hypothetical protein